MQGEVDKPAAAGQMAGERTASEADGAEGRARVVYRVRGQVQGVGFRPLVYRLAHGLGLSGWVKNDQRGVVMELQGSCAAIARFLPLLHAELPRLARIEHVDREARPLVAAEVGFSIAPSDGSGARGAAIAPDAATCPDCLRELFNPADRRYRYAFINCTQCGPRYTITHAVPYDRPNTSMRRFQMCDACAAEYQSPGDRRFHAQPIACPVCGPSLELVDASGKKQGEDDPLARAVDGLLAGEIVALKGLGGFHLACDARNRSAVRALRERKDREEKPFAVMAANAASLGPFVAVPPAARALLSSGEAPIVLLEKRAGCDEALSDIAPGLAWLGVMLPYTPLHYLLFHEAAGRPAGTGWLEQAQALVLVMTSANPRGEPLVTRDEEALERLAGIADALLLHEREILWRCDDSVVRARADRPAFIRRARGFTPRAIRLPATGPSVLACGGWYKSTLCLTRGDEAFLSAHVGDLDNTATCGSLERTCEHLLDILEIKPERVACDLHPDFFSSQLARRIADELQAPLVTVQHHHAHAAAIAAEHGLRAPHLALALDGVGLGTDGSAWGGELLRVDGPAFARLGHLRRLALPGGDRAAREPWRMAASVLWELGQGHEIGARLARPGAEAIAEMLAKRVRTPLTSSCGRWFDAAAALLGVCETCSYEGQAALLLEGLAEAHGAVDPLPGGYQLDDQGQLDLLPLMAHLVRGASPGLGAALFHATLAAGLADWLARAARMTGLSCVVLGGGCMLNRVLASTLVERLASVGLRVLEAEQAPPNDGALSLGQAWIAMQTSA